MDGIDSILNGVAFKRYNNKGWYSRVHARVVLFVQQNMLTWSCLTRPHSETRLVWNGIEPAQLDGGTAERGRGEKQDTNTRLAFAEIKKNCRCLISIFFAMIEKKWLLWFAFGIKFAFTSCQEQIWCTTLEWISHRLQTEVARWANCYVALPYVSTNLHLYWSIYCPMTLLSRILFLIC